MKAAPTILEPLTSHCTQHYTLCSFPHSNLYIGYLGFGQTLLRLSNHRCPLIRAILGDNTGRSRSGSGSGSEDEGTVMGSPAET